MSRLRDTRGAIDRADPRPADAPRVVQSAPMRLSGRGSVGPGPSWARTGFLLVVWSFVVGAVGQVFLAGLGVFAGGANFAVHRDFGYMLGLVPIVMLVLSLVGRLPRAFVLASILVFVLLILQSVFVAFRSSAPALAAVHPVNGFLITLVGIWLGWQARRFVGPPLGTATG